MSKKYPWAIRIEGGQIVFGLYDGKNWTGSFTKPPFKIEKKWVNIVAIKDAYKKETSLYIDGYLVSTNPLSLEDTNLSNNLGFTVGSRNLKNDSLYNGYMRDFAIFDRVLSGNEILRMYRSSK